jgi:hypothetical protein
MADEKKRDCPGENTILPGPRLPNGDTICLHHTAEHKMEVGVLVDQKEGQSLPDDCHVVEEKEGKFKLGPTIAELKGGKPPERSAATTSGPAQVANNAYRESYERTFGKRVTIGLA